MKWLLGIVVAIVVVVAFCGPWIMRTLRRRRAAKDAPYTPYTFSGGTGRVGRDRDPSDEPEQAR